MRYILDTCVLIWALEGRESKLGSFKEIILDDKNVIFVSIASYWEIVIKESIGRITAPKIPPKIISPPVIPA